MEVLKQVQISEMTDIQVDSQQPAGVMSKTAEDDFSGAVMTEHTESDDREMLDVERYIVNRTGYRFLRRTQDIFFSLLAIVVLLVPCLIVALIIFIDDPKGSPLFAQERVGVGGKRFRFFKFRSMCVDAESRLDALREDNEKDGPVFKIKNDPRITRVGRFIRKTSIDELPQLLNIVMGDMSIVGPRPALPKEVEQYNDYQKQRLLIKPGLTCYWQVQPKRDDVSFDEWMDLDVRYIKERSFAVDWKIIFRTVLCVFRGSGN